MGLAIEPARSFLPDVVCARKLTVAQMRAQKLMSNAWSGWMIHGQNANAGSNGTVFTRLRTSGGEATDARQRFVGYARDLRLNVGQFERDLDGEQTAQRVAADYERGRSIEINGTPTIFINGREIPRETITPKRIRETIDAALKERSR